MSHWYSGQPAGKLAVDKDWTPLDTGWWNPSKSASALAMCYLNIERAGLVWSDDDTPIGALRVRIMRSNDSDGTSAFQTFYVKRDSDDDTLITHVWFEQAQPGHKLRWEVRAADGIASFNIGTRYAKFINWQD